MPLKVPAYFAFLAMVLLCVGAILFYRERILFTDASLVSFRRINLQDLESSQRRWGAYVTECIPLLFSKLHAPLPVVLLAYSLSFNLFYLAVTGLLVFRWKCYALGILMSCYYLLFVGAGFYWTNNEIHQAVAYIFCCIGCTTQLRHRRSNAVLQHTVFVLLSGLAIFTHPLAVIVFLFLWLSFWIFRLDWDLPPRQATFYTLIIVSWSVLKLWLSNSQAYDSRRMYGLIHLDANSLGRVFCGPVATRWYTACLENYWFSLLITVAALIVLLAQRRWFFALWTIGGMAAFIALVQIGFPGGHFLYYLEGEWQTLGLIAGLPIVYALLPALNKNAASLTTGLLFGTRLAYIADNSKPFTRRLHYIENLTAFARRHHIPKIFVSTNTDHFESQLFMDWGLGTESMMVSALAGDKPQYTLCAYWPDHADRIPHGNKEMVWNFDVHPAAALNPDYFSLDTTVPYIVVPYVNIEKELPVENP